MKIKVLIEQQAQRSMPDRGYLASGVVADVPNDWALELLNRGDAEAVAQTRAASAERRPRRKAGEVR